LLKREYPHKNVGLKVFNTEPNPVATGAFERLESNQAEIDDLFDSDLLDSSAPHLSHLRLSSERRQVV
jgi:hypothetical protein